MRTIESIELQNKISVVTPVFNGIRYIEFCIKNVIDQRCSDVEHVIVDGGSTDGTVEMIRKYAEQYPHIRWVSEKDRGQSDAMNKGIVMASGTILSFLNVDDFYEQGVLNWVIERFDNLPNPSLLVGNCNLWDDNGKILGVNKPAYLKLTQLLVGDESIYPFPVNPSAYFYHKSLHDSIGMYDVDDHYAMDLDFILQAVKSAHVVYVDRLLGNFRYIEGTKTFHDMKAGAGDVRFKSLIAKYRKQLTGRDKNIVWLLSKVAFFIKYFRYAAQAFAKQNQNE